MHMLLTFTTSKQIRQTWQRFLFFYKKGEGCGEGYAQGTFPTKKPLSIVASYFRTRCEKPFGKNAACAQTMLFE